MEILLIRHGHAVDEAPGLDDGGRWLSGKGRKVTRRVARWLSEKKKRRPVALWTSPLVRAVQTAELAFDGSGVPVLHDWRLRECDYGELNGMPAAEMHAGRRDRLDVPYPGGESWRQAVTRGERFLADLPSRWAGRRIVVIGHVATRWALDHALRGVPVEDLMAEDFGWRPGWSYVLDT